MTVVMHLPISWTSLITDWSHVPAVSIVTWKKMCDADSHSYLAVLFAESLIMDSSHIFAGLVLDSNSAILK